MAYLGQNDGVINWVVWLFGSTGMARLEEQEFSLDEDMETEGLDCCGLAFGSGYWTYDCTSMITWSIDVWYWYETTWEGALIVPCRSPLSKLHFVLFFPPHPLFSKPNPKLFVPEEITIRSCRDSELDSRFLNPLNAFGFVGRSIWRSELAGETDVLDKIWFGRIVTYNIRLVFFYESY